MEFLIMMSAESKGSLEQCDMEVITLGKTTEQEH